MDSAVRRLRQLNPRCEVVGIPENVGEHNAADLIREADLVVDAAPMFQERLALNRAAFAQMKPMVECDMHCMEATVTTLLPGKTGCLACYVEAIPPTWTRLFPVFGAVSGVAACLGAVEAIKCIHRHWRFAGGKSFGHGFVIHELPKICVAEASGMPGLCEACEWLKLSLG